MNSRGEKTYIRCTPPVNLRCALHLCFFRGFTNLSTAGQGRGMCRTGGAEIPLIAGFLHQRKAGAMNVQLCSWCTVSYFRSSLLESTLLKIITPCLRVYKIPDLFLVLSLGLICVPIWKAFLVILSL